jgi:tRNA nucleotidyltransferase/poly(A) polymerase
MTISSLFSPNLKTFLLEIEKLGFSLCLVGGAPRDYLREKRLSEDLDFEIRNLGTDALRAYLKLKNIPFTTLPYEIFRVKFENYDLEFSLPRLETSIKGNKTHHHFEATLDQDLSFESAFKRRDFTINAIGMQLNLRAGTDVLVDPYNGAQDLTDKVLKHISDDFFLDSVRFLRLVRFAIKFNFSIHSSLEPRIAEFDLSELSKHHFLEEMRKSLASGEYLNRFNEMVKKYQLKLPKEFLIWNGLVFNKEDNSKEDLLVTAYLQSKKQAEGISIFFSLPEKKLKDLKSFEKSFSAVKNISVNDLAILAKTPINEIRNLDLLKDLKNLEDKKDWFKYFSEKLPVSLNDWSDIIISPEELEKTPVHLRSYKKYHKALQRFVGHE